MIVERIKLQVDDAELRADKRKVFMMAGILGLL